MKAYAQFFQIDGSGAVAEGCGTDSIMPLDGRLNVSSMRREALAQIDRLKNVRKYCGYQIRRGNIVHSYNLTDIISC